MPRQTKPMSKSAATVSPAAPTTAITAAADIATSPTTRPTASKQLSVAQMLVLGTAAQRPDHMVLPLPNTLRLRAGG